LFTPSATVHTSKHTINKRKHVLPAELEDRVNRKRSNKYYLGKVGEWFGGNRLGKDAVEFRINLEQNDAWDDGLKNIYEGIYRV
jgi:hypothetical protein